MSAQGVMALQKFTLPRLKLTHSPAFGKKSVGIVPREVVANETLELSEEGASSTMIPDVDDILFDDGFSPEYEVVEPTGRELESRSSVEGWEAIRIGLRNVVVQCLWNRNASCVVIKHPCDVHGVALLVSTAVIVLRKLIVM